MVLPRSDSAKTVMVLPFANFAVEHGLQLAGLTDAEDLFAGEVKGFDVLPRKELEREDSHADEVGAVDALVALGDDEADTEQPRSLGCPVARGAGAVLLAGEDSERSACAARRRRRHRRSTSGCRPEAGG